jgi:hypothetical protein
MPAHRVPLTPESLAALAVLMERQGGVVTARQAYEVGVSRSQVLTQVRHGTWVDLGAGVLGPDPTDSGYLREVAARLWTLDRRAVVSHASAGLLQGLSYVDRPSVPTLTVERGQRGETGVYVARLHSGDVTQLGGLPITRPERTLVDLLRTARDRTFAQALADSALRAGFVLGDIDTALALARGWPGIKQAREAWQHADGRIESVLESRCRVWFRDGGLPEPEPQVVLGDGHRVARVDFLFREQLTVVESDGRVKYDDPSALWEEKQREDWLRDMGFEVVRATWADGRDGGEALVGRTLRAFERAGRRAA